MNNKIYVNVFVFFFKVPSADFDITGFLESIQTFNHHNLINYNYENDSQDHLKFSLRCFDIFPSLELLFSFIKSIKRFI